MKKNKASNKNTADSMSNSVNAQGKNQSAQISETNSEQDSSTSKYTAQNDTRQRKDGPGGN